MRLRVCALLICVAGAARAQARTAPELPARLGADARASIVKLIDSARTLGLPATPLADKAAEGVLKGADDRRVVTAVQTLLRQLTDARSILGSAGDASLLGATASALGAGVGVPDLRRLTAAANSASTDPQALAGALVTLVDLVAKRIPPTAASASIEDLLKHRATAEQFTALRRDVEQDILNGQPPESALATRTRARVQTLDAGPLPAAPMSRKPPPVV